ncbi:MAG: hypothetical protein MO852_01145 [Candidatus Devosia euplotis]|nr:hypothetical protein [Candidatus Devosia euplotis]
MLDPQAIIFGGQMPPVIAQMLVDRTAWYGKTPRYGVWRQRPKLIVSEIGSDAAATGAAVAPFWAAFY